MIVVLVCLSFSQADKWQRARFPRLSMSKDFLPVYDIESADRLLSLSEGSPYFMLDVPLDWHRGILVRVEDRKLQLVSFIDPIRGF